MSPFLIDSVFTHSCGPRGLAPGQFQLISRMKDRNTEDLLTAELRSLSDGAAILLLTGEVDISSAHLLSTRLKMAAESGLRNVIIDATNVSFMDSTGLHALVEGKRLLHDSGTRIVLVPSPQVRRVLELVFPDPLFAARVDSVDDALGMIEVETDHEPL
jgi:anti-anti-sigma factor